MCGGYWHSLEILNLAAELVLGRIIYSMDSESTLFRDLALLSRIMQLRLREQFARADLEVQIEKQFLRQENIS